MLGRPSKRTRRKLEEHGKRAAALVVEIAERGMSISSGQLVANTELVLKTKLRVEPADEPAFEVEDRFRYPQLSIPSVGSRLAVIYDPSNHDKIMIDRSPEAIAAQFANVAGVQGTDLQSLVSTVRGAQSQTQDPQEPAEDPVDKLAKLAELREKGMLTDAEFETQKARILGES